MKNIQLLSVVFSLILFAGLTAGAIAFAEPGKYNHTEKLNAYCDDMSPEQQAELIAKHNKSEDKVAKMTEYCLLDKDGRTAFIEEHKDAYKNHGDKKHRGDMIEKLNAYCDDMSPEQQAELIAKHNKSEDKVAKMTEYCLLDKDGRTAFIEEHKDAYKNHGDKKHKISKKLMKNLSDEQRTEFKSEFKSLKAEFQALKTQLETDGELSKDQKRDLRMQFVEKAKALQLSWVTPHN